MRSDGTVTDWSCQRGSRSETKEITLVGREAVTPEKSNVDYRLSRVSVGRIRSREVLMFDSEEVTETSGWLNRNVVGLAINRFLSDFGHEAGTAILPLFLAAIGAPAIALGLIEGVADALSSFAKLFGGWLGDRVERRRPWAAAGYLLTGLTTGLYGMFPWWPWTLIVRTIGWAGRGLRSPLHDALLTDFDSRGRARPRIRVR